MPKIKLGDMTTQDKKNYQYYQRLLREFYIYGSELMQKYAKEGIEKIEHRYGEAKENAKN